MLEQHRIASTSASISAGMWLCPTVVGGKRCLTKATPAARTAAKHVYAIAPVDATPDSIASVKTGGYVDAAITGLGPGTASPVRVGSDARCERVTSFSEGDFAVGFCDTLGNLTMSIAVEAISNVVVDVVAYGADPTGAADSASAINAAIAALADGGTVIFPKGVFVCNSVLTVKPNTLFHGAGQQNASAFTSPVTTIRDGRTNPSTPLITLGGNDGGGNPTSRGCSFRDILFDFPSTGKTGYSVDIDSTTGITFYNCKFAGAHNGMTGAPTPGGSDPGLVRLNANELVVFQGCMFHYGTRQVEITGTGAGGPYIFRDCTFYDNATQTQFECASNGDHDISLVGCFFAGNLRSTGQCPAIGIDLKANGFVVQGCAIYGYPDKAPTGSWIRVGGSGVIEGCKIVTNSTAVLVSGCTLDFSGNNVVAYNAMNIQSLGSVVTGRGNSYLPMTVTDQSGNVEPFKHKRAVIVNDPYDGVCAVDIGPDTFGTNTEYKPALVAGKNISTCTNAGGLIKVTTIAAHGLETGSRVTIDQVVGTTEANGTWTIAKVDATSFTLNGSTFTHAYTSGGRVLYVAFWYESYAVGGEPGTPSYLQYTSGVIRYARAFDQSSPDGIGAPNVRIGGLVRLDCLDPQARNQGTGYVLTHADASPNVITPENFVVAPEYLLPKIHAGLEYTFIKRPDVVNMGNPALDITITADGDDKIFILGEKDGVTSIENTDTTEYNALITLRAVYWYDAAHDADALRWYVVQQIGTWVAA